MSAADDIREQFSAAYDDELPADARAKFEAALEQDPALKSEYQEFVKLLREANALGEMDADTETPDILAPVQARIRARSGGRFFRDKFSQQDGPRGLMPILMLAVMLMLVVASWIMMQYARVLEPATQADTTAQEPPAPS